MTTTLIDADGLPLTIRRGTSPTLTFAVVDENGDPKNLTGATEVTFSIAIDRRATSRDLQLTLGSGTAHNGTGGIVTVSLTAAQTEALPESKSPGRWCELTITDSVGRRDIVGEGKCVVLDSLVSVP